MSVITLTIAPSQFIPRIISNDETFTAITGAVQVQGRSGARWGFTLHFRRGGADGITLRNQLDQLQGMRNRLWVQMTRLGYTRAGSASGSQTGLVNGAHAAGATTLALKSLLSSTSGLVAIGDYLQLGTAAGQGQMVRAVTALNSSGTTGSLSIWPPLNKNLADGFTVAFTQNVGCTMIKTSDDAFSTEPMPATSNWFGEHVVELIEDVLA